MFKIGKEETIKDEKREEPDKVMDENRKGRGDEIKIILLHMKATLSLLLMYPPS